MFGPCLNYRASQLGHPGRLRQIWLAYALNICQLIAPDVEGEGVVPMLLKPRAAKLVGIDEVGRVYLEIK